MSEAKSKLPPVEVRALRTKEAGTFERLLCQLLIRANASEGLKKIDLMCQAFFRAKSMLPQNPIQINEDEVDIIHKVVTGLSYATPHLFGHGGKYYHIAWPFPYSGEDAEKNYSKYIHPWHIVGTLSYYLFTGSCNPFQLERIEKEFENYLDSLCLEEPIRYFFVITAGMERFGGKLSQSGYDRLVSQFQVWAMQKVDEWYMDLTKLVDQSVFDEIFRTMYAGEKKPEEEKS